jgi:hypothetical protein
LELPPEEQRSLSAQRRSRRASDPVASLTVYRDHPQSVEGPAVDEVEKALLAIFDADEYRVEHRAMVVDGESFVMFDVFRRSEDGPPEDIPRKERRGS